MKNILGSLPARLLLGVIAGILVGLYANEALMQVILTLKNLLGSLIIFCVPLIIIGFIAPSITRLGQHASTMLRVAITLAYVSSIGAAFFCNAVGLRHYSAFEYRFFCRRFERAAQAAV